MRFPNGHKGVKKLFASEILNIAATLLFFATAVISIINSKKSSDDRYLTAVFVLLLFAGIVAIVSFLLQIIGINQARKDGRYFGTALIFLFAGIPADIVASVTQGTFRNIFSSINEVLTLLVTVYIILGIYDLAEKLENKNLMLHGKVVLFLSASVFAAAVLFRTVPVFVPRTESLFNLIVAVMEFIGYLVFLIYLGRARKMLSGKV
ncbi:MAG: hypothetical protein ABS876_02160 [Ruminococcus sp.]